MDVICIISDNCYFSLGLESLQASDRKVLSLTPSQILENNHLLNEVSVFYVFVRNRQVHLLVCAFLEKAKGRIFFFIDRMLTDTVVQSFFLPSMAPLRVVEFMCYDSLWRKPNAFFSISERNRQRINYAASGLPHYMSWLRKNTHSSKDIHNQHRALLKVLGINTVSVHSLFLSEYIAAGMKAVGKCN
ncbi:MULTISPECIES: hypothetical protein [Enterobacterales]|uniref:hypothetical protein n=1 Tax=Enterobacterales TaxID=91347 RepID=UPI002ED852DA